MNSEKYQIGEMALQLKLPAGEFCYVFDGNGSTGKTYLHDLFKIATMLDGTNKPIMSSCYWDDCGKCQVCKVDCHNKLAAVLDSKLGKILFEYFSKNVKSKLSRTMSIF